MKLDEKEFDKVFEELGAEKSVLLLSQRKIETPEEVYFANRVFIGKSFGIRYLFWHGAGSSVNSYTKRDLHFIIEQLFDECKFWKLINWKEYNQEVDKYLDKEFELKDLELKKLNNEEE